MDYALLTRVESSDQGTFGILEFRGHRFFTGELPWRNNASNVSCIPKGRYIASFTLSPRFKRKMYLVEPVKRRAGIRIHPANLMGDKAKGYRCQLNGCVSLGDKLGVIDGQKSVLLSAPAVRRMEELAKGLPFELEIKGVVG